MTSADPNYFREVSIRAVLTELVERFASTGAARKVIIERALLLIMDNPEFDLSDPARDLLPIVRGVALDYFQANVDDEVSKPGEINEGHP